MRLPRGLKPLFSAIREEIFPIFMCDTSLRGVIIKQSRAAAKNLRLIKMTNAYSAIKHRRLTFRHTIEVDRILLDKHAPRLGIGRRRRETQHLKRLAEAACGRIRLVKIIAEEKLRKRLPVMASEREAGYSLHHPLLCGDGAWE